MNVGASSVFVAEPNTAAYPSAATSGTGRPMRPPSTTPRLAPMEKSGVTSPPWNPADSVSTVSANLSAQSHGRMPAAPSTKLAEMRLVPSPE